MVDFPASYVSLLEGNIHGDHKSPKIRIIPLFEMAVLWLVNGGYSLLTSSGVILQVAMDFNVYMVLGIFVSRN